ncbi:hypothetical protein AAHB34_16805 [Paenarthrobacter ureafaciens]|jgi:hypothetical protein
MENLNEGDVVSPDLLSVTIDCRSGTEIGSQTYTCSLQEEHDGLHLAVDRRPLPAVSGVDSSLPVEDPVEPASDPDELVVVKRWA